MKTTITFSRTILTPALILFAAVCLLVDPASAKNPLAPVTPRVVFDVAALAPSLPKEADFSDIPPLYSDLITALAPVAPKEATFDDSSTEGTGILILKSLRPLTPREADFIDSEVHPTPDSEYLEPILPEEASFDDTI
jgi:hypothetical protein